jgi:hypothetical protein
MRRAFGVAGLLFAAGVAGALSLAADEVPAKGETTVTDVDGKEYRLTAARLTTGSRRLGWLADQNGTTPDAKLGPVAIEVREPHSTTYSKGILTLVPAGHVESAKYDYEKQVVTISVAGLKTPLTGTLQYKGINVLGVAGALEGKTASFTGGVLTKGAVKSITFSGAESIPAVPKEAAEKGWSVKIVQPTAENPTLIVRNLKMLMQYPGGVEQLVNGIPMRKGQPVPFDANLKRFELLANDPNTNMAAAEIEVGGTEKVIAIPLTAEMDKKTGTLVGFLGEVDAGYKLFPLHTVKTITPWEKKRD